MFEKRKSPRQPVDEEVGLSTEEGSQRAQVLDLSAEGMRIRSEEPLEEGATVYLDMDFLVPDYDEPSEPGIEAQVQHSFQEPEGAWQAGLSLNLEPVHQRSLLAKMNSLKTGK